MLKTVKSPKLMSRAPIALGSGIRLTSEMMSAMERIIPGSTDPNEAAMSSRVTGGPRSERTGIGVVITSIIGCTGSVIFLISTTIGPRTSPKNDPTSSETFRNATSFNPSLMLSPMLVRGMKVLPSGSETL